MQQKKPPRVILDRLISEFHAEIDRFAIGRRRKFLLADLILHTGDSDGRALWIRLASRPYLAWKEPVDLDDYNLRFPGDADRILNAADAALAHRVNLLGSGPVDLGDNIDWHADFKTGYRWSPKYFRDIKYNNLESRSDVKVPWELSRMQWLIPVGQAYMLTKDDRYATFIRNILLDWIEQNPMGQSVNWACTMDVALRAIVWTWFFHVFNSADAWQDEKFQKTFLCSLFLHGDFVERYIEHSDVNGNHYTADAAGMVFVGQFFDSGVSPRRWANEGWRILAAETTNQVYPDGVDFEASVPYHRLVTELFLMPALYRQAVGQQIDPGYCTVMERMGRFTSAYSRPDGIAPVWGDADDARVLPFGGQPINDHCYLANMIATGLNLPHWPDLPNKISSELFWMFGCDRSDSKTTTIRESREFVDGGFYIMRSETDHVFIDCGPVGLAGRGGHGHNDCLSFEATLNGVPLIADCGAYLYTANYLERNRFRSTNYHNTPQIDEVEINRFVRPDYLWNLHYDAVPHCLEWCVGRDADIFCGSHTGFERLRGVERPVRTIVLDKKVHKLTVEDKIEGVGHHSVSIPFHFHPGVWVSDVGILGLRIGTSQGTFEMHWSGEGFALSIEEARISESYGVVAPSSRVVFRRDSDLPAALSISIAPVTS